jgi:hypothetical protein
MRTIKQIFLTLKSDPNLSGRILLILAVIAVMLVAIFLSGQKPDGGNANSVNQTPTPIPSTFVVQPVVSTPEEVVEVGQTNGVIVGVGVIVLIVIGGVLVELLQKKKS